MTPTEEINGGQVYYNLYGNLKPVYQKPKFKVGDRVCISKLKRKTFDKCCIQLDRRSIYNK